MEELEVLLVLYNISKKSHCFFLDIEGKDTMLLIISASSRPPPKPEFKDSRVKSIRFILVDNNYEKLLECQYNEETFTEILKFLNPNHPNTALAAVHNSPSRECTLADKRKYPNTTESNQSYKDITESVPKKSKVITEKRKSVNVDNTNNSKTTECQNNSTSGNITHLPNDNYFIKIDLKAPPQQVAVLHNGIQKKLQEWFSTQGLTLTQCDEAPAIITVINSSRIVSDIKRDFGRATGITTFFSI